MTNYGKALRVNSTPIPGLLICDLPVHGDNRGWFKENWQREKMVAAGLPDFGPVQNNISFNDAAGTTRGIHAEPWDKFVSVATGRIFGAWVDLRAGATFGAVYTAELDSSRAVFVPRGVANSFQTLENNCAYSYLVNDHYSPSAVYSAVNLADESLEIRWPISLSDAEISVKDRAHPLLRDATPIPPRKILVVGADGQLGRALRSEFSDTTHVKFATRDELDLSSNLHATAWRWRDYGVLINAAAYTAVDNCETPDGRAAAWKTNVIGTSQLARIATENGLILVHISSDYVFDGTADRPYGEDDLVCPMGVYGQTKAAADQIVSTVTRHYVIRTSWVIGDGNNFVRTMLSLANRGVDPAVVNDQHGRLTFATDLARAIRHLLETQPNFGIYNVTGGGSPASWAEIAKRVFELSGHDPHRVKEVTTAQYFAKSDGPVAPRPKNSVLDLSKIMASGFQPNDDHGLTEYLQTIPADAC